MRFRLPIITAFSLFLVLLGSLFNPAQAREAIVNFHSDIKVERNGDLLVTETITVLAENISIRRGIYRDFPRLIENASGKRVKVGFDILSITRNDKEDDWFTEDGSRFTRIYIGNKDVIIPKGLHVYKITYRTDRQIRFFDNHDELFWNVTGTEWEFVIERASATITLPDQVQAGRTNYFTGRYGSKDQFARAQVSENGNVVNFETTQTLSFREGFSVVVEMPKGSITAPSSAKELQWILRDYLVELFLAAGAILLTMFYTIRWLIVGRDLPEGIIVPRWDVPKDMSPALMNYINGKGFGDNAWKALISATLNLAVKGYVELKDLDDEPTIYRTDKPLGNEVLPVGERILLNRFESYGTGSIRIDKDNGKSVKSLHSAFKNAMEKEHRQEYYKHNVGSIVIGIIFSILCLIGMFVMDSSVGSFLPGMMPFLVFGGMGTYMLSSFVRDAVIGSSLARKIRTVNLWVLVAFAIISTGIFLGARLIDGFDRPLVLILLLAIVVINVLFFFLMGAPTPLGREKMDVIDGMRTYLDLAEKDRMNMKGAPEMSPTHYENLLPYAVALGLEKPWSKAFQAWLLTAAAAGVAAAHYSPGWYRGRFRSDRIGDSIGNVANNLESSFTASLPVEKSSSSGFSSGGGFSGGGGGGGGGGGW